MYYRAVVRIGYCTISNGKKVNVNRSYSFDFIEELLNVAGFTHALMLQALEEYSNDLSHGDINYLTTNVYNMGEGS